MNRILAAVVILGLIAACKPETKPIGSYYKAGEGIPGKWVMSEMEVTDITLPVAETRDLNVMLQDPMKKMIMTISEDGTYTVDQKAFGPDIFGTAGTWLTDTATFPTAITFLTNEGDTVETGLLNMPRVIDVNFGFSFTRNRCDKDYVTYNYRFNRE